MSEHGDAIRAHADLLDQHALTLDGEADDLRIEATSLRSIAAAVDETPEPEPPDPEPPEPPTGDWWTDPNEIIARAGLLDASLLKPSGSVTSTKDGQVFENLDIKGTATLNHHNCRFKNCRFKGTTTRAIVSPMRGIKGTVIEHCDIEAIPASATEKGATGCVGYLGSETTVRHTNLYGYADGIKVESQSLYEYNYVHMKKNTADSALHMDGIQGSGDTEWVARRNVIVMPCSDGGNQMVFAQAWNGSQAIVCKNIHIYENFVKGGNSTLAIAGAKDSVSNPASYMQGAYVYDNWVWRVQEFVGKTGGSEGIVRWQYWYTKADAGTFDWGNKYWSDDKTWHGVVITATNGAPKAPGWAQGAKPNNMPAPPR